MRKNNFFIQILLFLVLVELLSIFAWIFPIFNTICFAAIIFLVFLLSLQALRYGVYVALAELIIDSQGYLFSLHLNNGALIISLRIGLFAAVMLAWVIHVLRRGGFKFYWQKFKNFPLFKYYLALALVIIWGLIWGIMRNDFANVFFDFNNWLFFAYLLPFISAISVAPAKFMAGADSVDFETRHSTAALSKSLPRPREDSSGTAEFWRELKSVLLAALVWLAAKTFIFLYIFSHEFAWVFPEFYTWVRDTRVGEITPFAGNFYRVFLQSQIYCLLGFFILLPFALYLGKSRLSQQKQETKNKKQETRNQKFFGTQYSLLVTLKKLIFTVYRLPLTAYFVLLTLCLSATLISFSRSFWAGLIFSLIILFAFLIKSEYPIFNIKLQLRKIVSQIIKLAVVGIAALLLIFIIIKLPPQQAVDNVGFLISNRATEMEAAGSSRLNMLGTLKTSILKNPLLGSGFGTTVTYRSVDPRVLTTTAGQSGEYTTYAFEWAYLDMILKFGLFGTFIYLILIWQILKRLKNFKFQILNSKSISNNQISDLQIEENKLRLGLILAVLALLAVNFFTPYLNHPLGIGFILLVSIYTSNLS